ncbi:RnfABCDGE type electron transport complex subunit D [Candidatus Woesearchaeota archaeon]|nr:RnfABCDGE type electron transport complex subunit D [Candidatus Woesearchaeota archaeon]
MNKKLVVSVSPHIKSKEDVSSIMWLVVLALLPAMIGGIIFFKVHALLIILLSTLTAVLTEYIIQKLTKKEITIKDGSAAVTGVLLALVIPPSVPLWVPIAGSFFAVAIAKHAFGGLGFNIFNPALAGRAFLTASWPLLMATWLLPDGTTGATPLGVLKFEGIKAVSYGNLFLGNIGGSLGETSALAILLGAAFLLYKKIIDWRIPAAYLGTVALLMILLRQDPTFHLLAGGLMLGAFFMATDYVTTPITEKGRLVFGVGCGLLTVLIRGFGGLPGGVALSILLMNSLTPLIDRYTKTRPFGFVRKNGK